MTEEKPVLASLKLKSPVAKEFLSEFLGTFILVVCMHSMRPHTFLLMTKFIGVLVGLRLFDRSASSQQ